MRMIEERRPQGLHGQWRAFAERDGDAEIEILRGAFVEFGLSLPPLIVVFQFNPLTISRSRTASIVAPRTPTAAQRAQDLTFVQSVISSGGSSLISFRAGQTINVQQETRAGTLYKREAGQLLLIKFPGT